MQVVDEILLWEGCCSLSGGEWERENARLSELEKITGVHMDMNASDSDAALAAIMELMYFALHGREAT